MQLSQLLEQIENQFRLPPLLSQIVSNFEQIAQQSAQQSEEGVQRQVQEKEVPQKAKGRHTRRREPLTYERAGSHEPKVIKE